ncbi:hypothetical protein LguiA_036590 [Lonicera macranthoides]
MPILETQPPPTHYPKHPPATTEPPETTTLLFSLLQPIQWLKMLSLRLNPTFVLGIFLVYGLSQGFAGSFFHIVSDYYWKDVQKVEPSAMQLYIGIYYIPWIMKPLWGLLTDVFPVMGYRRRPYFVFAGVLGVVAAMVVAVSGKVAVLVALVCMVGITGGVAIADVTIDACVARNSIDIRELAADMQSLCGVCSSIGALVGYSISGFFVHHLGPQGVEKVRGAMEGMYKTMQFPQVWKPTLYMYLSLALSISTHEGQFYWYTDPKAGPAFSQELIGMISAIGALASIVGVVIYHKFLKHYPFRNLLFFAQLLYTATGMLDLIFISRWNLTLGIPDSFFIIAEHSVSHIVSRVRWMPMIVLSTRLCPIGIEGTFFALLMCIDSLGTLSSKWGGGIILHLFSIRKNNFENLWMVVLIRNLLRFATLGLIFLVPNVDQLAVLVPADLLMERKEICEYDENLELVPLKGKSEVQLLVNEM